MESNPEGLIGEEIETMVWGGTHGSGRARAGPGAHEMDSTDRQILEHLQADARLSSAELARRVSLSAPGLQKRLKKLEDAGIVRHYATILDREALGLDLLCFVQVSLARHHEEEVLRFREHILELPEVLECHHLTGEADYLMKVVVANRRGLERFLVHELSRVAGVDRVRTSIVLDEVKATTSVPLGE